MLGRSIYLLALLLTLVSGQVRAQASRPVELDPELPLTTFVHNAWNVKHGLPQNTIRAGVQTADGYIWLGTQAGLVRFDGVSFRVFNSRNTSGLASDHIIALLQSRAGDLWIATERGLTRMREGRFHTYTVKEGLSSNDVLSLYEDRSGHLWVGTVGGGLNRFDGKRFVHFAAEQGLPGNDVLAVEEDAGGRLWVGTEGGLAYLQGSRFVRDQAAGRLDGTVVSALDAASGELWIGTFGAGVCRLRSGALACLTAEDGLPNDNVRTLLRDSAGSLWIGTRQGGLSRLYKGSLSSFTPAEGLTDNIVRSLWQDAEGSLWIGTENGGLNRLRSGPFATFSEQEGLSHNVVLAVTEDHLGGIWIGTEGGGLNRLSDGRFTRYTSEQGLSGEAVYALHEDRQGVLWVGLLDGGLCRQVGERFTCLTSEDGLPGGSVYAVYEDRRGNLWAGTEAGLARIQNGKVVPWPGQGSVSHMLVRAILEDRNGDLWLGTDGSGIVRLRRSAGGVYRVTKFTAEHGLASQAVLSLHQDRTGALWAGTLGGGLCRLEDDRFSCFGARHGLPGDDVFQMVEDDDGNLWLGTLMGIVRLTAQEFSALAEGRVSKIQPQIFQEEDGLASREANGGTQPAAWRTRDGRLWFSTMGGVAVVDPTDLRTNKIAPPVYVESFTVGSQPVARAGEVRIGPGRRNFTFKFTALSYLVPEEVRFKYKLEGYDADWIEAGAAREVNYTSLPPGEYRFVVTAANNDGVWNEEGAAFAFNVAPFFYQTAWFYALTLFSMAFAAAGVYRLRIRQLQARQMQLQRLVNEQTREIRTHERKLKKLNEGLEQEVQRQLDVIMEERIRYERELIAAKNKAEESARLKSTILNNMSHEIRTPITAILGYAQILGAELTDEHAEFVQYIEQNGKRLLDTLSGILDLSKLEAEEYHINLEHLDLVEEVKGAASLLAPLAARKGIVLRTESPLASLPAELDRSAISRIIHNLVGNAIKFTDQGEVAVALSTEGDNARIEVRDTGIGIEAEFLPHLFEAFKQESGGLDRAYEGTGLGLSITRRLIEYLGGTISVASRKGEGTEFSILLPLSPLSLLAVSGDGHNTSHGMWVEDPAARN